MSRAKKAIIIHGWGADSSSNWFPWLVSELRQKGFWVRVPDFPNTENPDLSGWLSFFTSQISVDQDTILIGHSLGVPFILRYLEKLPSGQKVKAALLVSGFERPLGNPETENFVKDPFDWEKIKRSCAKFVVINSDNDPYIPLQIGKDLAQSLATELMVEKDAGHINAPGGYLAYPRLLNLILNLE